jgi:hypothetical protein
MEALNVIFSVAIPTIYKDWDERDLAGQIKKN